jgi:glycosyltransferase involved in cell wall biosynthesis
MKILIDATTTQDQFASRGIGVTTKEVISTLLAQSKQNKRKDHYYLLLFKSPTTLDKTISAHSEFVTTVDLGRCRVSGKFDPIWWRTQFAPAISRIVRQESPDLYYSPYFFRGVPVKKLPFVAMVYDFAFPKMGRYSSAPWYLDWIRKAQYHRALRRLKYADGIAAISDWTRKDLRKIVPGVQEEKTQTIYLGIREDLRPRKPSTKVLSEYLPPKVLERGYILYYGGAEVNKNVPGVVRGYKEFLNLWEKLGPKPEERRQRSSSTHPPPSVRKPPFLVLAGGDFTRLDMRNPEIRTIRDEIHQLDLKEYVEFTGFYKDEHLVDLLNGATAFIHLSYYEGFGFSPLEAMKCGTPVVASDRSCYPEVLNDGAVLVNPDLPESVGRALVSLALNPEEAERQGKKGLEWVARYSWDKTANELYDMFKKVVETQR